jgi:hypothetical protein
MMGGIGVGVGVRVSYEVLVVSWILVVCS